MGKKKVVTKTENIDEIKKTEAAAFPAGRPKKSQRAVESGRVHIRVSYNNTIVTVTDNSGNVLAWASAGSLGFSGPKKATPFASQKVIAAITEKISRTGPFNVDVFISGMSVGRDAAIRSLVNHGFNILSIKDITPIPHNGPRPKKIRRV